MLVWREGCLDVLSIIPRDLEPGCLQPWMALLYPTFLMSSGGTEGGILSTREAILCDDAM